MNTNKSKYIALTVVLVVALLITSIFIIVFATTAGGNSGNNFTFNVVDNKAVITSYTGADENVVIPSVIRGKRVSAIGEGAFKDSKVKNIEFEDSKTVINIENDAFMNASSLIYVKLPTKIEVIGKNAFNGCTALTHITMPDTITKIEESAFYNCKVLSYNDDETDKKIVLPSSLTSIGNFAFYNCYELKKVVVPNSLKTIGNNAFQDCTRLEELVVNNDNQIVSIGDYAFNKTRIKSNETLPLSFPKLESIGKNAFDSITVNFDYFLIPASVKSIGNYAFSQSGLSKIEFESNSNIQNSGLGEGVFSNMNGLVSIQVKGSTTSSSNHLPDSITVIPALTFSGSYKLLSNRSFNIGKNVTEIKDGAFALYNRTISSGVDYNNYAKYKVVVDINNDNFEVIELDNYYNSQNGSALKHQVLVNKKYENEEEQWTILAYFGAYDNSSRWDTNSTTSQEFNFLTLNSEIMHRINAIGAYAFAGVNFKSIVIPKATKTLKNNVFANSLITAVYFNNKDCEFDNETFKGITSTATDEFVILLKGVSPNDMRNGTIYKQWENNANLVNKDKISISTSN